MATPEELRTALAQLAAATATLTTAVSGMVGSSRENDADVKLSLATPILPCENHLFAPPAVDAGAGVSTANPRGTTTDIDIQRQIVDAHRARGKEIFKMEKTLPHDGYINHGITDAEKHNAYKSHPITSSSLVTEADVNKAETKISSALQSVRWDSSLSWDHNVRHVFKSMICTPYF